MQEKDCVHENTVFFRGAGSVFRAQEVREGQDGMSAGMNMDPLLKIQFHLLPLYNLTISKTDYKMDIKI